MTQRFSARNRRRTFRCTPALLAAAVMLGATAPVPQAGASELPLRLRGVENAGVTHVKNSTGIVETALSVSVPDIAELIAHLPDGTNAARDGVAAVDTVRLEPPAPGTPSRFGLWAEGYHRQHTSDGGLTGRLVIGAGYEVSTSLTVGALAGVNRHDAGDENDGNVRSAGPYVRFQPTRNISVIGLSTWRRPETNYDGLGFDYVDPDDRFRLLHQLRGDWHHGPWRFTSSAGYERENVNGDKTRMLYFGPAFGYRFEQPDGTVIEPHLGIKGRWELDPLLGLDRESLSPILDAKIEGGVRLQDFTGWSLDASASAGDVGDPDKPVDWRGNLDVTVPLN